MSVTASAQSAGAGRKPSGSKVSRSFARTGSSAKNPAEVLELAPPPGIGARSVIELRIPVAAAATRRQVQHRPERGDVRGVARILAGVRHLPRHLAGPEQPYPVAIAPVDDQRRILA